MVCALYMITLFSMWYVFLLCLPWTSLSVVFRHGCGRRRGAGEVDTVGREGPEETFSNWFVYIYIRVLFVK